MIGIDDHSRFCVAARLMPKERTQLVCDGFAAALSTYGEFSGGRAVWFVLLFSTLMVISWIMCSNTGRRSPIPPGLAITLP